MIWIILLHCLGGIYAWLWRNRNEDLFYGLLLKTGDLEKLLDLSKSEVLAGRSGTLRDFRNQMVIFNQLQEQEKKLRKKAAFWGLIWTALRTALPPIMILVDIILLRHLNKKYAPYEGLL
jgi:hypothetical protein